MGGTREGRLIMGSSLCRHGAVVTDRGVGAETWAVLEPQRLGLVPWPLMGREKVSTGVLFFPVHCHFSL